MTKPRKRPIKPRREPARRDQMPEVPTVADHLPAHAEAPVENGQESADDEAVRRMVEAAYT